MGFLSIVGVKRLYRILQLHGRYDKWLSAWLKERSHKHKSAERLRFLPIFDIMKKVMKMDDKKELPQRKKNCLENYDYSSCGAYFITICTLDRKNYF